MRFLKEFLKQNPTLKVVPKVPEADRGPADTTPKQVSKVPEVAFDTFGTHGALVYRGENSELEFSQTSTLGTSGKNDRPSFCEHCSGEHIPEWRRGGKIIERTWPDGRREWACHYCGRAVDGLRR